MINQNKISRSVIMQRFIQTIVLSIVALISINAAAVERVTYYHNDALGSPVAATDQDGNLLWREEYEPYGERILREDADTNNLWYTGKQEETAFGINYFGARWYDPTIGRFMAIDPQGFDDENIQSFNRYAYANNNPYLFVDPNGESPFDIGFFVVDAIRFAVAVNSGDAAAIQSAAVDLAASAVGLASPVPGTGQVLKAARLADKANDTRKAVKGASGGARAGRPHTRAAIKKAKETNAKKNNGTVKCVTCGVKTTPTTRRTKGSKVDPREGQGDHIIAKSKGGDGATVKDQRNIDIKCASCNNKKSNN